MYDSLSWKLYRSVTSYYVGIYQLCLQYYIRKKSTDGHMLAAHISPMFLLIVSEANPASWLRSWLGRSLPHHIQVRSSQVIKLEINVIWKLSFLLAWMKIIHCWVKLGGEVRLPWQYRQYWWRQQCVMGVSVTKGDQIQTLCKQGSHLGWVKFYKVSRLHINTII